jgi:hypothetical protein
VTQYYGAQVGQAGLKITQYSLRPDPPQRLGARNETRSFHAHPQSATPIDGGWLALGLGADSRSRLVSVTCRSRKTKRSATLLAHRAGGNQPHAGCSLVGGLHALIDDCLELLSPPTDKETGE